MKRENIFFDESCSCKKGTPLTKKCIECPTRKHRKDVLRNAGHEVNDEAEGFILCEECGDYFKKSFGAGKVCGNCLGD